MDLFPGCLALELGEVLVCRQTLGELLYARLQEIGVGVGVDLQLCC